MNERTDEKTPLDQEAVKRLQKALNSNFREMGCWVKVRFSGKGVIEEQTRFIPARHRKKRKGHRKF